MAAIAIIGAGISGLHLALYLQARGVDTTLYIDRPTDQLRAGRLPNCVMRWAPTVERDRALSVYRHAENEVHAVHVRVEAEPALGFCGRLSAPANTTDFRIYLPDLIEDYLSRGGRCVVGPCDPAAVAALAPQHELVVVAAGRGGLGGTFPRDDARSPHRRPPRHLTAGLYRGAAWPDPAGVEFTVIPGLGEIFQVCFHSFDGPVSAIAVEGIPGGPLAALAQLDQDADPSGFDRAVLAIIHEHAPSLRERIDAADFGLTRPLDLLQGQITPVVRRAWADMNGTYAIALGDAWITHDPIAAQGANLGSRCAFLLAELITTTSCYDQRFCLEVEQKMGELALAPTALSLAMLEPPGPELMELLAHATVEPAVADRFADGFGHPDTLIAGLSPAAA